MSETAPTPPTPSTPPTPPTPGSGGPPATSSLFSAPAYAGPEPDKDAKTMAMLAHLLGIFTGFVGALVIWLIKKDQSPFVNDQGREALNFQITMIIGWVIAGITAFICIGAIVALAIFVVNIIFCIMGAMKANNGIAYRYPFAMRLVK